MFGSYVYCECCICSRKLLRLSLLCNSLYNELYILILPSGVLLEIIYRTPKWLALIHHGIKFIFAAAHFRQENNARLLTCIARFFFFCKNYNLRRHSLMNKTVEI